LALAHDSNLKRDNCMMKTTEDYIDDILDKYNELVKKEELWRLRVTPQEFIAEIERIRKYGKEARKSNYLNEYHIQCNENGMVSNMLMDKVTREEFIEQCEILKEAAKKQFAEEAPLIQQQIKQIKTPLKFQEIVNIYRWLFRKQITLEMLSAEVLEEFKMTTQYEILLEKMHS
jgi:hypothetical protein